MMHDKRLKKYSINFTVFGNKKVIVKSYQNHNGTIVGFITQSKSIEFTMKKFAVCQLGIYVPHKMNVPPGKKNCGMPQKALTILRL